MFSLKTFAAALMALFIAFWLGLDDPRWALLTVYVVAQPNSGLVIAKSFYRFLGTAAGLLFTIALTFAFAQYGEIFVAGLAVWIGLCSFAARAERNFTAYAFQLAGYTVAIIGLPAALDPGGAYPLIVSRFTEIALGMGCEALVSSLVWPSELAPKLVALVGELMQRADRFAAIAIAPADEEQRATERAGLAKLFGKIEDMRSSAYFESDDARLLSKPLRRIIHAAVDLCAIADAAGAPASRAAYAASSQDLATMIRTTDNTPRENATVVAALRRAADSRAVASARTRLCDAEAAFKEGEWGGPPVPAGGRWSDPVEAGLIAVRSALAVSVTAAFWFATAWPSGATAVVVAAVACILFASTTQPAKISLAAAATCSLAAVPVFVTQFHLLPYAIDFASMAVALAPLLLVCGFIMAQPAIGPLGLLVVAYFEFASKIDNGVGVTTYDAIGFLNASLAILVGLGIAFALFATFFPETPAGASRRFRRQLFAHLSRLAADRQPPVQAFQMALLERLATTLTQVEGEAALAHDCLAGAATAWASAHAIKQLRTASEADRLAPRIADDVASLLGGVSKIYHRPCWAGLTKRAWQARVLCRRSLAMARAAEDPRATQALAAVVVACEALRCSLLKARKLLPEKSYVH